MAPTLEPSESRGSELLTLQQAAEKMEVTTRDVSETKDIKIENCIGFAKVPLGLAGPLTVHGENGQGTIFAPLATLEATLVASCSRGCKAIQQGGGMHAAVLDESMARAPIFYFNTVSDAIAFYRDVQDLFPEFKRNAEKTSGRAKLRSLTPHVIGTSVHVKFDYSTALSTGQNMTTIATFAACKAFMASQQKDKYKVKLARTEAQFASDKKLSWGNVAKPRGVQTLAWATVSSAVCKAVLGSDAKTLYNTYLDGVQAGIRNGMQGYNINTANVLAAIFIATGQDCASVLEGGWSQLTFEYDDETEDLTVSLFFPSLPVGTVGGGTGYATQREALALMDCTGENSKRSLAEKITGFALALELSTLSAITNNTFSESHRRLARSKL